MIARSSLPAWLLAWLRGSHPYRRFFEQAPIPLAFLDWQRRPQAVNRCFVKTFGYTLDDLPDIEHWWALAYPDPDYRAQVIARWQGVVEAAVAGQGEIEVGEYRIRCRDGSDRVMLVSGVLIDEGPVAVFIDVTEQQSAEARLRSSQAMLAKAEHLGEMGSWTWDFRADLPEWSEGMYRIFGRDPALGPANFQEVPRYFTRESWGQLAAAVAQANERPVAAGCRTTDWATGRCLATATTKYSRRSVTSGAGSINAPWPGRWCGPIRTGSSAPMAACSGCAGRCDPGMAPKKPLPAS